MYFYLLQYFSKCHFEKIVKSILVCALITLINIYVQFFFGTGLQTAAQVSTDTRLAIQDAGTLMKASRPEFGNPNSKSELHWG